MAPTEVQAWRGESPPVTPAVEDVLSTPLFHELIRRRRRLRVGSLSIMLLIFGLSQVIWALYPELANRAVPRDGGVTLAIWLTVAVVLSAIALSGYYAVVAGRALDRLSERLIRQIGARAEGRRGE